MGSDIFAYQTGHESREWLSIAFFWGFCFLAAYLLWQMTPADGWPSVVEPFWQRAGLAGAMCLPFKRAIESMEWD